MAQDRATPQSQGFPASDRAWTHQWAACGAVALMLLGACGLVGWQMDWPWLTRLSPQWVPMMPNTALGFLCTGFGLWALLPEAIPRKRRIAGRAAGVTGIALGAAALIQYSGGLDWGIDEWWFTRPPGMAQADSMRIPHASAVCFILSGLSLSLPGLRHGRENLVLWSALLAGVIGLLAVTGYLYDAEALYGVTSLSRMAMNTALGFVIFAASVLLGLRRDGGPEPLSVSPGLGGQVLRFGLLVVVIVPVGLGGLILHAARTGLFDWAFGFALLAVGSVLLLSTALWLAARWLERIDAARKSATDQFAASERTSREIIEALPQLVWTCLPDGPCDYLSRQWLDYTGVPEAEQLGYGWLNQLHPADHQRTIEHWQATAGKGLHFSIEFRIRRHDGVYRWFKTLAQPLRGPGGEIVKWFGTNTDIEGLKQAEETQAWMAAVMASSAEAIIGQTLDGAITSWNASAETLFGYSAAEIMGQTLHRMIPADRQEEDQMFLLRVAAGDSITDYRTVRLRKDQSTFPASISLAPVRDATGRVTGASKTIRDITEQVRSELELRQAHESLEEKVRERTTALSESNAALAHNARQLAEAQRVASMGSWMLDVASGEVEWSEELFHIVGLDPADRPPNYARQAEMFTADSWARLTAAISNSVELGAPYELELEVVRPDGAHRMAMARASAGRDADGHIVRLTGTFQDITEIKRAREALDAAALRMKLATEAAELGVWEWNIGTGLLTWDDTMRHLYDWSGETTYDVWRNALHPDDRAEAETLIADVLRGEAAFDHVFRICTAAGTVRHIHGVAEVHRDAMGVPQLMIGVNRDVTAEHEARLRLRASEELLRDFVRYAPAAIAMLDRDLVYLQASERWLVDYNLQDRNIIGLSHYELFPDLPESWKEIHRRVLDGAIDRCDEAEYPRADGQTEWLQWEVRPWRGADGKIGGLIIFTQVITARKRMEIQLREQKAELQRSNQELEQFAYVASHDLQEPLRAVTGFTQLLQKRLGGDLDARSLELMHHTIEGAKRMESLIHDLLAYSRVGSGAVKRVPASLSEPLAGALANLRTAIEDSGCVITQDEKLPIVPMDSGQITQLLQNLLGNALKYRQPDVPPRIHVSAAREGSMWRISISDNGIGIEPRYFERIFVIFQRLHTRTEYSGTGIGLAICKKIVERHGGRISVESKPLVGTTFHFTLPALARATS